METITAFFTKNSTPATGLTPTIRIRDLSDNSLVVTDAVMTEVGDGAYKYNFIAYSYTVEYSIRCDGGITLSGSERFTFGGNDNFYNDTENAVLDASQNSHKTLGTIGCSLNDISYTDKSIYINTEELINGDGKSGTPFNAVADAVDFAELMGWKKLIFLADATLERTLKNFVITGIGFPVIDLNGQNVDKSAFIDAELSGEQVGYIEAKNCELLDGLSGLNGHYVNCFLAGNLFMANGGRIIMNMCSSYIAGLSFPTIDFVAGYTDQKLSSRGYSGGFGTKNMDHVSNVATLEYNAGKCNLDSSNSAGTISIRGIPDTALTDNSGVGLTVEILSSYPFGQILSDISNVDDKAISIENKIDIIDAIVDTINSNVVTLDGKVVAIGINVDGITTNLAILDGKVVVVDTVVDGIAIQTTSIESKVDTVIGTLSVIDTKIDFIKDIEGGRWHRVGSQMIFYKEDNTTEIARFNLLRSDDSTPAGEGDEVFQRVKV